MANRGQTPANIETQRVPDDSDGEDSRALRDAVNAARSTADGHGDQTVVVTTPRPDAGHDQSPWDVENARTAAHDAESAAKVARD